MPPVLRNLLKAPGFTPRGRRHAGPRHWGELSHVLRRRPAALPRAGDAQVPRAHPPRLPRTRLSREAVHRGRHAVRALRRSHELDDFLRAHGGGHARASSRSASAPTRRKCTSASSARASSASSTRRRCSGATSRRKRTQPPTGTAVAVLSYGLWQTRFGGASEVLGKPIQIGATLYTIIGVAPRGFDGIWDDQASGRVHPDHRQCRRDRRFAQSGRRTVVDDVPLELRADARAAEAGGHAGAGERRSHVRLPEELERRAGEEPAHANRWRRRSRARSRRRSSPIADRTNRARPRSRPGWRASLIVVCSSPARTSRTCCWRGRSAAGARSRCGSRSA